MKKVYDLREDPLLETLQRAALEHSDRGLSLKPALVGTEDWWNCIEAGTVPFFEIDGVVSNLKSGPMGDWPSFEVVDDKGNRHRFDCKGGGKFYSEGLAVRIKYAIVTLKNPGYTGNTQELLTEVWLQDQ